MRKVAGFSMIAETRLENWRADTFWEKEPETLLWIEKEMSFGGVFWDVGANIGIYTLYAASLYPRLDIYAFEPYDGNCYRLQSNARLNKFVRVHPQLMALSDDFCDERFYIRDAEIGSSGHQIGSPIDEHGKQFKPLKELSYTWAASIDYLVYHSLIQAPNYIKIDVDGAEGRILSGMTRYINDDRLKTVLIEVNQKRDNIIEMFQRAGFNMDNEYNRLPNHSRVRRSKENGNTAENIIFKKVNL